jgi:hypothetical protein
MTAAVEILEFVPRRANSLQGFAQVRLPSGMVLHDVGIYINGARAWASPPSKPMIGRDGVAMRDDKGKIRYVALITFATKDRRDRFSEAIIEAMRIAHPDALVPAS